MALTSKWKREYNIDHKVTILCYEVIYMLTIKPSAAIRKNYNEISELCKKTKQPIFLTKNGEGDLVVMDMETYSRRESALQLREHLLQSQADIQSGNVKSVEETVADMRRVITEASNG